jgi:hypothetical protein
MCEKKSRSGKRAKKRKFCGNQHTKPKHDGNISASGKKLKMDAVLPPKESIAREANFNGYRLMDIDILFEFIAENLICKDCGGNVSLREVKVHGLSSKFSVVCECKENNFSNCKMIGSKQNIPEINRRFAYAMRMLGQGRAGMEMFCCGMDLPPPVAQKSYTFAVNHILDATSKAAQVSMKKAAQAEAILSNSTPLITVSGDGTWKTRGHNSRLGVCSVIGAESGQVIDTQVMSSYCKKCEYSPGSAHEDCLKNHFGSSGMMEVDGMLEIFSRSEKTRGVKYIKYIGDGDTKTFSTLSAAKPYGNDLTLEKIECVGHIQKRMGSRLRKLKQNMKKVKLSDGRTLSGKGRLTDTLIDQLSTYFGNAIREHKDSLTDMRKAIWAIFYHKKSTDEFPTHDFCPSDSNTWCKYNKASVEGVAYHHKNPIPSAVMEVIKPIFKDLSQPSLLKRCLGGKTQNPNESFNSTIWKFCPKTSSAGRKIVEIATNEATILFNGGCHGRHDVMDILQLFRSPFSINGFNSCDKKRIADAERRATMSTKEKRKLIRSLNASKNESLRKTEGEAYSAGAF